MTLAKKKIRNPVAEAAAFLTKPARHRDRKNDYERREKHRKRGYEDEKVPRTRKRSIEEQRLSESEDWLGDSEGELGGFDWLEPEEESPDADEVQ